MSKILDKSKKVCYNTQNKRGRQTMKDSKEYYVPLRLTPCENTMLQEAMQTLGKNRSETIRIAILKLSSSLKTGQEESVPVQTRLI